MKGLRPLLLRLWSGCLFSVPTDLIYEGITTDPDHDHDRDPDHVPTDLIYEGITTLQSLATGQPVLGTDRPDL